MKRHEKLRALVELYGYRTTARLLGMSARAMHKRVHAGSDDGMRRATAQRIDYGYKRYGVRNERD